MEQLQAQPPVEPKQTAPAVTMTKKDRGLALILLVLGYLFCRFGGRDYPVLNLFYETLLLTATVWYFGGRLPRRSWLLLMLGLILGLSQLLTDNGTVQFFSRFFGYCLWAVGVFYASDNGTGRLLIEGFKAAVLLPFVRLGAFFSAAFQGGKSWIKTALLFLGGLVAALIPVAIVGALLSYDEAFAGLLKKLFSDDPLNALALRLSALIWGMALAVLAMSIVRASREHRLSGVLTQEKTKALGLRLRFLPEVMGAAMVVPLLLLYGLFFFSQLPVYTAAFTGVLPEGYTYAGYAREGFFQLCAVCAINALLCLGLSMFTKKGRLVMKGLLLVLCLCSLVLGATACSKMVLYIGSYGLTPKRVYASWAMVLLMGGFLLALVGAVVKKLPLVKCLTVLFFLLFGGLCLVNTDGRIADYNVTAYEQGRLPLVDMKALTELGDAAVPAAARLAADETYGEQARVFLSQQGNKDAFKALCHGFVGQRARNICKDYWRQDVTVQIRLETDTDIAGLELRFGRETTDSPAENAVKRTLSPGDTVYFYLDQQPLMQEGESLNLQVNAIVTLPGGRQVASDRDSLYSLQPGELCRLKLYENGKGEYFLYEIYGDDWR